jgi:hypothetical protein
MTFRSQEKDVGKSGKLATPSAHDKVINAEAVFDILWQAAKNDWFKYPLGSRLIFFQFPARYCTQAKRVVKMMYTCKGPSARRRQPPLKPNEKAILKRKIIKFVGKKYLVPLVG